MEHLEYTETHHVVCDLETLGTDPDAVILSVGLVRVMFDDEHYRYFIPEISDRVLDTAQWSMYHPVHQDLMYRTCNMDGQIVSGRTVDINTHQWWSNQASVPRQVLTDAILTTTPPVDLSMSLRSFICPDDCVWGKGPTFDNAILRHYIKQMDSASLWKFRNDRCLRTIDDFLRGDTLPFNNAVPHHAFYDAYYEAQRLVFAANKMLKYGIDFLGEARGRQ